MSSFKILTPTNPKTEKGRGAGYWTFILHLAPASLSGFNTCPMATLGCKAACLNTAGRGGIMAGHGILTAADVEAGIQNTIQKARIRKTRAFFENRAVFMFGLVAEMERAIRMAERAGLTPVFRLNGTSDIRWETIAVPAMAGSWSSKPEGSRNLMEHFGAVQFYDYTKIANRRNVPRNYSLTFSHADGNAPQVAAALANGMSAAVVFRDKSTVFSYLLTGFMGAPVVPGDDTDLRFLDPAGSVVALYAKGNAKRDTSGFVVD